MLVIFKSKAGADIIMFEENARQILDIFEKDINQGIITVAELPEAIHKLENQIAISKLADAEEAIEQEKAAKEEAEKLERLKMSPKYDEEEEARKRRERPKPEPKVSFSARAFPFLELMKAALKKEKDIYWGA